MKKLLLLFTIMGVLLIRCESFKGEQSSTQISRQALNTIELSNISNSYEKKILKEVLEMRDNSKLINHFYTKNETTQYINLEEILLLIILIVVILY